MKKKDIIFIAIIVAVIALFIFLSVIGRKPPALSSRPEHTDLTRNTPRETCLACHAPDSSVAPMSARHPKKGRPPDQMNCFVCHRPPASDTAGR